MRREEHYCDICGNQMTGLFADGDQYKVGVELNIEKQLQASLTSKHSYGTSGKAEWLSGREYCSFTCFEKAVLEWLKKVSEFFK